MSNPAHQPRKRPTGSALLNLYPEMIRHLVNVHLGNEVSNDLVSFLALNNLLLPNGETNEATYKNFGLSPFGKKQLDKLAGESK